MDDLRKARCQQGAADEISICLAGKEIVRQHALLVLRVFKREDEGGQRIAFILDGDSQRLEIFGVGCQRAVVDEGAGNQGDLLRLAAGEGAGGGAGAVVVFVTDVENPLSHFFADEGGRLRIQGA